MPRRKKSLGRIVLGSPFNEELQRWLRYELENTRQWNPNSITGGMSGTRRWKFEGTFTTAPGWTIEWTGEQIIVVSEAPVVWIRKGLEISMGQAQLILHGGPIAAASGREVK